MALVAKSTISPHKLMVFIALKLNRKKMNFYSKQFKTHTHTPNPSLSIQKRQENMLLLVILKFFGVNYLLEY